MSPDVQLIGREYRRVSYDKSGRERSNAEQADDNRRVWESQITFSGDPYQDKGSASRYARNQRDDFPRLVDDLEADRFGANVLVMWEHSRGSRKVSEWCQLIELCEDRGVKIAITTHNRIYDPSNARDVRSLIDDANDSQYESAKTSTRVLRGTSANASAGRPHGVVPLGYQRVYDPRSGQLAEQELHPDEAPIVAELFARIVKGHSLKGIARDFEARGIRNRSGTPFVPQHLRSILRNPLYIGKRVHQRGKKRQGTAEHLRMEDVTVTDAIWPAIVSEPTYWAVQQILSAPDRKTRRPGSGKHLLSLIAGCDPCDGPLTMLHPDGPRRYRCQSNGCVKIAADDLDAFAEEVILTFLARSDAYEGLGDGTDDTELEAIRGEIAKVRHELRDLEAQLTRREIPARMAGVAATAWEADLEKLEARERELSTPHQLRGIIEPGPDVASRWAKLPMSAKRTVAKVLLSRGMLGELRVGRASGRKQPVEDRVVWLRAVSD